MANHNKEMILAIQLINTEIGWQLYGIRQKESSWIKYPSTCIEQKEDVIWTYNGKRACIIWQEHEKLEYKKCLRASKVEPFTMIL